MDKTIKLLYVDDEIDNLLSSYLDENFNSEKKCEGNCFRCEYSDLQFSSDMSYVDLLNNKKIRSANIIIIDSRLFSNDNSSHKYMGEEIELLIRKSFPFIEMIVITQNEVAEGRHIIKKFPSTSENDKDIAFEHYREKLNPIIQDKCKSIVSRRLVAAEFQGNEIWDPLVKEMLRNSFNAESIYEELTKKDIDQLVNSFKQIEKLINKDSL